MAVTSQDIGNRMSRLPPLQIRTRGTDRNDKSGDHASRGGRALRRHIFPSTPTTPHSPSYRPTPQSDAKSAADPSMDRPNQHSRPLASATPLMPSQPGAYDNPPASAEPSTFNTRYPYLHRAIVNSRNGERLFARARGAATMSSAERRRLGIVGPVIGRRRRRSASTSDPLEDEPENVDRSRRSKRRRFDSPPPPQLRKPIKYGHNGQVDPGRLQLELVSCDGGQHQDPRHPDVSLGPENVLRHDKTVYCSESSGSTITLRHADETPFVLEKLHIIGPEHGFTAPVRAGVVHVAMTMAELRKHIPPPPHARRWNGSLDRPGRESSIQRSPERLSLSDALRDPEVDAAMRQREAGSSSFNILASDDEDDWTIPPPSHPAQHQATPFTPPSPPGSTTNSTSNSNGLICTLNFDSEPPGPEDPSPQDILDFRLNRLRTSRRRYNDPDPLDVPSSDRRRFHLRRNFSRDPSSPPFDSLEEVREHRALSHLDAMMARSRVYDSPGASGPSAPHHQSLTSLAGRPPHITRTAVEGGSSHMMSEVVGGDNDNENGVWTRRFFVPPGKHRVAMTFDPPISGRFIMLRLESGGENVDVQAVVAEGYGGGRFFPAVEMR